MRVVIYDSTAGALSTLWRLGAWLAVRRGHAHESHAVHSWAGLVNLLDGLRGKRIMSISLWGHGSRASPQLGGAPLDSATLDQIAERVRAAIAGPEAVFWFRSCSTFATSAGQRWAERCARSFGCRVAGHTFSIGRGRSVFAAWQWGAQSGLHVLRPGEAATWPAIEGVGADLRPLWSSWSAPATVGCLSRGPT